MPADNINSLVDRGTAWLSDKAQDIADLVLPDAVSFNGSGTYVYPYNLFDPNEHSQFFIIAPYTGELDNKKNEDSKLKTDELAPIFLPIPLNIETSYSHNYSEESLIYNLREIIQGGGRSGGLKPQDKLQIVGQGAMRDGIRLAQAIPIVGNNVRASYHGGARSAIELLYDSPNLREYSMNWKFIPDDAKDEKAIFEIYKYLMWLSAPTFSGISQRYPAIFDMQLAAIATDKNNINSISTSSLNSALIFTRCYITSITPNLFPNEGPLSPAGLPQEFDLTITFKECMPLDRDTINKEIANLTYSNSVVSNSVNKALGETPKQAGSGLSDVISGVLGG